MNTDKAFAKLLEVSPELAGRVGRMRHLNAENAKKSAEFWNTDQAWAKARAAQTKYEGNAKIAAKRANRLGFEWRKRAIKSFNTPIFDEKNHLKKAAAVGAVGAAAYGAHRLHKWWKSKKAKPTTAASSKAPVKKVKQDPTQPESYPFRDSAATRSGNLMEAIKLRPLSVASGSISGEENYYRPLRRYIVSALTQRNPATRQYYRNLKAQLTSSNVGTLRGRVTRESSSGREYIPGGLAAGMPAGRFPKKQLRMGRKVEMEHTNNPRIAEEIAKDHLVEIKDYYTRLHKMERKAKRGVQESSITADMDKRGWSDRARTVSGMLAGGVGGVGTSQLGQLLLRGKTYAPLTLAGAAGGAYLGRNLFRKKKTKESTDAAYANLMEGLWDKVKGAARKAADKYVTPVLHSGIKFPGAEPHSKVQQGHVTKAYRMMGGKGMGPTLIRHKQTTGMGYRAGPLDVIHAPPKGTPVTAQLRRGKGVIRNFKQSSGMTHEVGHAALTNAKDVSHLRMSKVEGLNKHHTKNAFGGISAMHPKAYALQSRLHMRAEGRNNTFVGTSKNRLKAAKASMTGTARAHYNDVKRFSPEAAPAFVKRYKNFRRSWRKGDSMAHLKLSNTDQAFSRLFEADLSKDKALVSAWAKMKAATAQKKHSDLMKSMSEKVGKYRRPITDTVSRAGAAGGRIANQMRTSQKQMRASQQPWYIRAGQKLGLITESTDTSYAKLKEMRVWQLGLGASALSGAARGFTSDKEHSARRALKHVGAGALIGGVGLPAGIVGATARGMRQDGRSYGDIGREVKSNAGLLGAVGAGGALAGGVAGAAHSAGYGAGRWARRAYRKWRGKPEEAAAKESTDACFANIMEGTPVTRQMGRAVSKKFAQLKKLEKKTGQKSDYFPALMLRQRAQRVAAQQRAMSGA
jgi:hypothetical protein